MNDSKRIALLREENEYLKKELEKYRANEKAFEEEKAEYEKTEKEFTDKMEVLKTEWETELRKLHSKQEKLETLLDEVKAMKNVLKTGRIPVSFKLKRKIKNIKKI